MSKRNREVENTLSETVTEQKPVETPEVKEVEKAPATVKEEVNPLDKYTDEELLAFIEERKKKNSAKYAIKSVNVPMHTLVSASAVHIKRTPEEQAVQARLRMLETYKMREAKE